MRFIILVFFVNTFLYNFELTKSNQKENKVLEKVMRLARIQQINDSISQLLVVYNLKASDSVAVMVALERKNKGWKACSSPIKAGIGKKGFAQPGQKREGDKKTPTGLYGLGQLFCYETNIQTRMPWQQSTAEDKWIDDPGSPDYNRYVKGATNALSFEKLKIKTNDYRYCMVIEYNSNPVVKGMGSAIFLHLGEGTDINPSAGCVVIKQNYMEQLLKWMSPDKNPSILMGNEKVLSVKL